MSQRAELLARRFERAHEEFVTLIEGLSHSQWQAVCSEEQCTVAALARHVALAYAFQIKAFARIAAGQPRNPLTWDHLARVNAADAATFATSDRTETISLLHANATQTAATIRSFTDDHLAHTGLYIESLPTLTVDQWLRHALVKHITTHLASIRTTLGLLDNGTHRSQGAGTAPQTEPR